MSELQDKAKQWINSNVFDGDDRSDATGDRVSYQAPELYELINDLVEHLEVKWVSVNDLLPVNDTNVLVFYGENDVDIEIDYTDFCSEQGHDFWVNSGDGVTHWMPLPEPPEEKSE